MRSNHEIQVIFFDMGNTLLHFHYGSTDEEKDEAGLVLLTAYLQKLAPAVSLHEVRRGFFDIWMKRMADRKTALVEYPVETVLGEFMGRYDVRLTLEQAMAAMETFYTDYRNQVWFEPGLGETLTAIRSRGYRLAVLSNACLYDEVMISCFVRAGLAGLFDSFTFSYGAGVCKPRQQIFLQALGKMAVESHRAMMVGDNVASDLKPALTLGMQAVWYSPVNADGDGFAAAPEGCSRIGSIAGLLDYLD